MAIVQLRRYELVPGTMDDFLAWVPRIVPVRAQYGFEVLFAFADRERNEFTWAVRYEGDLAEYEARLEVYNASPERAAVFEGQPQRVAAMHLALVDPVV